jgi:hypothetical protein
MDPLNFDEVLSILPATEKPKQTQVHGVPVRSPRGSSVGITSRVHGAGKGAASEIVHGDHV